MDNYRRLRVDIYPGEHVWLLAVTAQTVAGGARRDRLLHRATVDPGNVDHVAAALRTAADALHDAADSLM